MGSSNKRSRSATKGTKRGKKSKGKAALSPAMQWIALAGIAALGILAVFVFGIGQSGSSNQNQFQGIAIEAVLMQS